MNGNQRLCIGYVALLVSIVTSSPQELSGDEVPSKLTLSATEEGGQGILSVPIPYVAKYTYRGPDDLHVSRSNHGMGSEIQIVRFGTLRVGSVLPVAGELYRVLSANQQTAEFEKIAEKALPADFVLTAGSYALPLGSKGRLQTWEFQVEGIAQVRGKPQVTILGFERAASLNGKYYRGDSLNIDGSLHRLLRIVPPGEGLEGWIEIEMEASAAVMP